MKRYVIDLHELSEQDYDLIGGKARGLARLARAGLPVPPGFVITTEAYVEWERLHASGTPDKRAVQGDAWDEVRRAYDRLVEPYPGAQVAVRSSASIEDELGSSYAGQFRTTIGVSSWDALVEAVVACWESLSDPKSSSYAPAAATALRAPERQGPPAMAVIVQLQVPAEVSGVLFTLNPQSGRENEMLVEASWGLGEAVVSGLANPDRYVLDAMNECVGLVQVNDKRVMVVSRRMRVRGREISAVTPVEGAGDTRSGGGIAVNVPEDLRRARALEDRELLQLMDLGIRIQSLFGLPQDVEWALWDGRFFVLQSRPLTAFSFASDFGIWTSANFREVMPGFASYLSQSMSFHHDFARATDEVFRRLNLRRNEDGNVRWADTLFGHGYWNVGATKQVAARMPGFKERAFDRTVGIPITYEGDGMTTPWTPSTVLSALPSLFALRKHYRLAVEEAKAFTSWYDANEPEWDKLDPSTLPDADLTTWVRFGVDLHWRANRWALIITLLGTQAQDDFHVLLDRVNRAVGKNGKRISEAKLLTGISRIATAQPVAAIWELARFAEENPAVSSTLRDKSKDELAGLFCDYLRGKKHLRQSRGDRDREGEQAEQGEHGKQGKEERHEQEGRENRDRHAVEGVRWVDSTLERFWSRFEECLRRFRYMSEIDEDLSVPRWGEDPALPLSMLKACLSGELSLDPRQQLARQEEVREEEERRTEEALKESSGKFLFPFIWRRFKSNLDLVRRLAWWREETRVYLSRARYHTRRFLKEQGIRWAKAGVLDGEDDIFWLSRDEVLGLLDGTLDHAVVRQRVRYRRRIPVMYRNFVPPAVIMPGRARILPGRTSSSRRKDGSPEVRARVYLDQSEAQPAGEVSGIESVAVYTGMGCSGGSATGRARVVRSLEEAAELKKGEVLVAPFANPGWTPLFSVACAIVLEEGGLLSHSAVVAREYGIPAVLQVEGATSKIRTGDLLLVDGSRGTVEVIQRAEDAVREC